MPRDQPTPSRAELIAKYEARAKNLDDAAALHDGTASKTLRKIVDGMAQEAAEARAIADALRDAERLETMFKRCSIVFYHTTSNYPIEYSPLMDSREVAHRREMLIAALDAATLAEGGRDHAN